MLSGRGGEGDVGRGPAGLCPRDLVGDSDGGVSGDMQAGLLLHASVLSRCSHVRLFVTPWTAAHQAPLSLGFSRH